MSERYYKIKDSATGLFSTGGLNWKWNNQGKRWLSLAAVKLHIAQPNREPYPATAELIEFTCVATGHPCSIASLVQGAAELLRQKQLKRHLHDLLGLEQMRDKHDARSRLSLQTVHRRIEELKKKVEELS